jgi:hypothetical protein
MGFDAFIIPGLTLSKVYGNSIVRSRIKCGRNEIDSDYVVDHFAIPERQPELQRGNTGASVSLLAQPSSQSRN